VRESSWQGKIGIMITFAIAGLALELRCADEALAEELHRHYAAFRHSGPPALVAEVEVAPPAWRAPATPTLAGSGPYSVGGTGLYAELDLANGRAALRVEHAYAAAATDYFVRVACALLAYEAGGLLLHAAGLARGERGFLLLGPSGVGKTTAARHAAGARVLNDDLVLLMPAPDGWRIHATPFSNPSQVAPDGPGEALLTAMLRLAHAPYVAVEPIGQARATAEIAALAPAIGLDPTRQPGLLRRAHSIAAAAPCGILHFTPDASYWNVIDLAPVDAYAEVQG
jgi:hypothetical protein